MFIRDPITTRLRGRPPVGSPAIRGLGHKGTAVDDERSIVRAAAGLNSVKESKQASRLASKSCVNVESIEGSWAGSVATSGPQQQQWRRHTALRRVGLGIRRPRSRRSWGRYSGAATASIGIDTTPSAREGRLKGGLSQPPFTREGGSLRLRA